MKLFNGSCCWFIRYVIRYLTVDMGDMGKITFDQGAGVGGISTIDDKHQVHTKKYGIT